MPEQFGYCMKRTIAITSQSNLYGDIFCLKFSISMQDNLTCLKALHIMLPVYIVSTIPVDSLILYFNIL